MTPYLRKYRVIRDGILLNALNPKLSLFFLVFLPQFVPATASRPTLTMTALALVFMAMTFAVFVIYGACASAARDHVITRPKVMVWLKRSFAGAFILLGLRLALGGR
jgi:threonine/homoserine/homoserine lactone efflux protein